MFKKKPPAITIGSSLGVTQGRLSPAASFAAGSLTTSVKPSALAQAGDALGSLIFKSAPVVLSAAEGIVREFGDREDHLAWTNEDHPDYLLWRKRRNNP
jgi:hypothetical protein